MKIVIILAAVAVLVGAVPAKNKRHKLEAACFYAKYGYWHDPFYQPLCNAKFWDEKISTIKYACRHWYDYRHVYNAKYNDKNKKVDWASRAGEEDPVLGDDVVPPPPPSDDEIAEEDKQAVVAEETLKDINLANDEASSPPAVEATPTAAEEPTPPAATDELTPPAAGDEHMPAAAKDEVTPQVAADGPPAPADDEVPKAEVVPAEQADEVSPKVEK